jgi:GNAT superfamily N-acetyltransferase
MGLPTGYIVRRYDDAKDRAYIATTWLHTAHDLAFFQGTPDRLYYPEMQKVIEKVLENPRCTIAVVADKDDPDFIIGWLCAWVLPEISIAWYAYTRSRWRKRGIASHLVSTMPGKTRSAVFTSRIARKLVKKNHLVRYPTLIFKVLQNDF